MPVSTSSVHLAGLKQVTPRTYRAGTLAYTQASLITLFAWLLWGDFVFTLMEAVMPSLLPLLLREHGASNREIVTIASTLYMAMNAALNPVISFQSDRLRTRWGRRRPFIFATTPLVVLFLSAVPFAPEIAARLKLIPAVSHLLSWCPLAPVILIFGLLVAGFQIFNMFISSVYYYLIRDVVPVEVIGRFYGLFRVFGTLATTGFNLYILGLAEKHMKEIFVCIALCYGFFILLMAWRVQEGEYPPLPKRDRRSGWDGILTYFRECFGSSYYWWVFLAYSALGWGASGNALMFFFYHDDLGFSLEGFGQVTGWAGILFALCAYPFGLLMDRWGCHKALMLALVCFIISSLLMYTFAVDKVSGIFWTLIRNLPLSLCGLALGKWTVEVYPSDRYGQFGSAGALFASVGGILAAIFYGYLVDCFKNYRIFLLWHVAFAAVALVAVFVVYRRWSSLGGPLNYRAP